MRYGDDVRAAVAVAVATAAAALAALILGEYEFTVATGVLAGAVLGFIVAEVVTSLGRWRGVVPATVSAGIAAAGLAWAGWIDAGHGLERYPNGAWAAVAVGAAVAAAMCIRAGVYHPTRREREGDDRSELERSRSSVSRQ